MFNLRLYLLPTVLLLLVGSQNLFGNHNEPENGADLSCPPGDVNLYTQADVDGFAATYPACTTISGKLTIGDPQSNSSDVADLSGLAALTLVTARLEINDCPGLASLNGLHNIAHVGGFILNSGSGLTSLAGISGLQSTDETFWISFCPLLTNLSGLENLGSVGGMFSLSGLSGLTSLAALDGLSYVGGQLQLENLSSLTSLAGLENLNDTLADVNIAGNAALTSLAPLSGLKVVTGNFQIQVNNGLTSLAGLDSLVSVGGIANIFYNNVLSDISALSNCSLNTLLLFGNTALSACSIESICALIGNGGSVSVSGNGGGCASVSEIQANCPPPPCPNDNIVLLSQAEVDDFVDTYSSCADFPFSVTIGSPNGTLSDITDLSGLSALTHIGNNLTVQHNPLLASLYGLHNLVTVGNQVTIFHCDSLNTLAGLESLDSIGGFLSIAQNGGLDSLTGLNNLRVVNLSVDISTNLALLSTSGLNSLQKVGTSFWLQQNWALNSLSGLENLDSIGTNFNATFGGGSLFMTVFDLQSLDPLSNLKYLNGGLYIQSWMLPNLNAFSNLNGPLTYLHLQSNYALTDISGLQNIPSISGYLIINGNYNLPDCNIQSVCDYLSVYGTASIAGNGANCQNPAAVGAACGLTPTGYQDADGDGYGDPAFVFFASNPPSVYVANNSDCDDQNPLANPAKTETCTNDFDDDCDGQINEPLVVNLTFSKTLLDCNGDSDGSLRVNPPGAASGWTYLWNNGETTRTISNLSAGTYSVVLTKISNMCTTSGSTVLQDPPALSVGLSTVHNKCFGQTIGKVVALAYGGTGTKTFSWSTGSTSNKIENLAGGDYFLTVSDAKGCTLTSMATVVTPPELTLGHSVETLANGRFRVTLTAAGGTPYATSVPYRYCRLNNGNCVFTTSSVYTNLVAGTYTFMVRDKNACSVSIEVVLPPTQPPVLSQDRSGNIGLAAFSIAPNPIVDQCVIAVSEVQNDALRAVVFDLNGRQIAVSNWSAGQATLALDSRDWPAGVLSIQIVRESDGSSIGYVRAVKMK